MSQDTIWLQLSYRIHQASTCILFQNRLSHFFFICIVFFCVRVNKSAFRVPFLYDLAGWEWQTLGLQSIGVCSKSPLHPEEH